MRVTWRSPRQATPGRPGAARRMHTSAEKGCMRDGVASGSDSGAASKELCDTQHFP